MSARKVVKRACDGCKIRKIRCSEQAPCEGCIATGIACTFVKHPAVRGPRKLRKSTLQEISQTQAQQHWQQLNLPQPPEPVDYTRLDYDSVFAPAKIAALVLQLCIFRLRVYPIWPIIKVERLVASLQKPEPDIEVFALAYAVAAATIIRIKTDAGQTGGVTAAMMESQCLYAKGRRNKDQAPDLTTVRIPLFLHFYHETIDPGGLQSLTCLREAIAVAHMIGLHREKYYSNVQPEEQEIRRRTLWLLFVTERGVSIKHKLPVTIKTTIKFPSTVDTDEREVLLAFQRLIAMFWHFDQSGVFELLDNQDFDLSQSIARERGENEALSSVRRRLDETLVVTHDINSVQALDIVVTRQWMRVILWRLAESHGFFATGDEPEEAGNNPISIAQELIGTLQAADKSALEAHGTALETKIFEIASTVADACNTRAGVEDHAYSNSNLLQAQNVLAQLQHFLFRNPSLANMLHAKMSRLRMNESGLQPVRGQETRPYADDEIERQLQAHGFHFTEPVSGLDESPEADAMTADMRMTQQTNVTAVVGPMDGATRYPQSPFLSDWSSLESESFQNLTPFSQMLPEMAFDHSPRAGH